MKYFKACAEADLSCEKPWVGLIDGVSVCVLLSAGGELFAFENKCTHEDKPLHRGKWDSALCQLTCPFHQAVFSLSENGAVKVGPALLPLQMLPHARREELGILQIYVGLDDED